MLLSHWVGLCWDTAHQRRKGRSRTYCSSRHQGSSRWLSCRMGLSIPSRIRMFSVGKRALLSWSENDCTTFFSCNSNHSIFLYHWLILLRVLSFTLRAFTTRNTWMFLLETDRYMLCMQFRILFWDSLSYQFCWTSESALMHSHWDLAGTYQSTHLYQSL